MINWRLGKALGELAYGHEPFFVPYGKGDTLYRDRLRTHRFGQAFESLRGTPFDPDNFTDEELEQIQRGTAHRYDKDRRTSAHRYRGRNFRDDSEPGYFRRFEGHDLRFSDEEIGGNIRHYGNENKIKSNLRLYGGETNTKRF